MQETHTSQSLRPWGAWHDFVDLTRPREISLFLLVTLVAMIVARESIPPLPTVLLTLVGGYLAAGGARTLNCYLDRDVDARMERTRGRTLPMQRVEPRLVMYLGLLLSALAVFILWWGINLLSSMLALAGTLIYVLVYTYWLKPRSAQSVLFASVAGAIPVLVGWAAATGTLSARALILFVILFCWSPPHFWALGLMYHQDYSRAGLPTLPVMRGSLPTRVQIAYYSIFMVALTIIPTALGFMHFLYAEFALLLGSIFIYHTVRLLHQPGFANARRFYIYSLLYLALIFSGMVVDRMVFA